MARYVLDYDNFKLVARNAGSIGRRALVVGSIGTFVASGLNGHCPVSFSAVV